MVNSGLFAGGQLCLLGIMNATPTRTHRAQGSGTGEACWRGAGHPSNIDTKRKTAADSA
jgi:hypothetical protein